MRCILFPSRLSLKPTFIERAQEDTTDPFEVKPMEANWRVTPALADLRPVILSLAAIFFVLLVPRDFAVRSFHADSETCSAAS